MQTLKYYLKRHAVSIVCVLVALLAISVTGNVIMLKDYAVLALGGVLQVGTGIVLILLVTKFAFPKLNIQETIKNDPIAVAVFAGFIAVAIALLF